MRKSLSDAPTSRSVDAGDQVTYGLRNLLVDLGDTTWRLFVPTVCMIMVGRYGDVRLGTKPWLMLLGATIGSVLAGLLIRQQIARGTR